MQITLHIQKKQHMQLLNECRLYEFYNELFTSNQLNLHRIERIVTLNDTNPS